MEVAQLLTQAGLRLPDIALCLHKPGDPKTRNALAVAAAERPELFEAYQSTHADGPESTVRSRPVVASFLAIAPEELTFIGLYERDVGVVLSAQDMMNDPVFMEMLEFTEGHRRDPSVGVTALAGRTRFTLRPIDALSDLKGRLVVQDPGGRNYLRLAETTPLEVIEIKRGESIVPAMPSWDMLQLTAQDIATLPRDWAVRLADWRGIYLLVDEQDGARYVGAAYGEHNLLGRWQAHVAGEAGITAELSKRSPASFRFSVLELVSPAADIQEVTRREQNWMARLHTKAYGLN